MDEAIAEFQLAAKDESRMLECSSMLGICFLEKGMAKLAVKWFEKGLAAPGRSEEEYQGLRYDLAMRPRGGGRDGPRARHLSPSSTARTPTSGTWPARSASCARRFDSRRGAAGTVAPSSGLVPDLLQLSSAGFFLVVVALEPPSGTRTTPPALSPAARARPLRLHPRRRERPRPRQHAPGPPGRASAPDGFRRALLSGGAEGR